MVEADAKNGTRPPWLVTVAVVVVVVIVAALAWKDVGNGDGGGAFADEIERDRFQAVFLTNDRVYFGNLRPLGDDWYELRNAYFIRERPATGKQQAAGQQVAPIGEELQEPGPHMLVNGEQIVQVQNLRSSSRVAEAIEDLQE